MVVSENISLKQYNSFGIDVKARLFAAFTSLIQLEEILSVTSFQVNQPRLILGGGSNILFTKDFNGLVLKNEIKGIQLVKEDADHYYVKANAGENWHQFVMYCINHNYAGIENLSLIPGNVGASPMQNIGAYGVEIKDVFHELEAYHIEEKKIYTFSYTDCEFGYRESIFKKKYKGQFIILNVTFCLFKHPSFHTQYGAIEQELSRMQFTDLTIRIVSEAVINIRTSKLPDPTMIGNAGSFFKNPVISQTLFDQLKNSYPSLPGYPSAKNTIKIAAGWLIETAGWKGYRNGDAGCYDKQALVLVNYGHAKGDDIYSLSQTIIDSVEQKFNIKLEREVNII